MNANTAGLRCLSSGLQIDAREYLDKVGPLRRAEKRSEVPDVVTPQHAGSSLIEVVVARPGPPEAEPRHEAMPRALSGTSSTAETVHRVRMPACLSVLSNMRNHTLHVSVRAA